MPWVPGTDLTSASHTRTDRQTNKQTKGPPKPIPPRAVRKWVVDRLSPTQEPCCRMVTYAWPQTTTKEGHGAFWKNLYSLSLQA